MAKKTGEDEKRDAAIKLALLAFAAAGDLGRSKFEHDGDKENAQMCNNIEQISTYALNNYDQIKDTVDNLSRIYDALTKKK